MLTRLEVKGVTADAVVLEGLGVVFGSIDRVGEYFDHDTDFWEGAMPAKIPVMFEHGRDPDVGRRILGFVQKLEKTPLGLKMRLVLDRAGDLAADIVRKVQAGALGLSTGSVAHLTQRAGAKITSWPIFELSLTENPAEILTMDLHQVKSLPVLNHRLRHLQYEKLIDECWDCIAKYSDYETRRWWGLMADILEMQQEEEDKAYHARLQRAGKLTKRLNQLEGTEWQQSV